MAADLNRVVWTCRLTRDPELRMTESGMAVMNIGIAFNDRRKNAQTGEWEDAGNFADAVMFGNRAQTLANYLHKGSRTAIEGKLRWSSWERDGQKRSKLEILVDEMVLLDPRQDGQNGYQGHQNGAQGGYQQQAGGYNPNGYGAPQNAPQQPQGYQQWSQQQYAQQQQAQAPQQPTIDASSSVYDDDIPF